jgi:hypothetical protein
MGLISPRRIDLGKTELCLTEEEMQRLQGVKDLLDEGITLRTAFDWVITGSSNGMLQFDSAA